MITSSATRARTTAEIVIERSGVEAPLEVRSSLYGAGVDGWMEEVRSISEGVGSALVVGHEPTCSAVVETLAGVRTVYPTAGLAGLAVNTPWSDLGNSRCELEYFLVPRLIEPLFER